jgi:undecaprenyl-diphosphatase
VFTRVAIIAVGNMLLMFGLKYFFNRQRPLIPLLKEVPGLSFPSGHAYMGLVFFGQIIYLVYTGVKHPWIKWITITLLVFIIFMIGLSRVYLRLHYSSDVIAGYCFGLLSLLIIFWLLRQVERVNTAKCWWLI